MKEMKGALIALLLALGLVSGVWAEAGERVDLNSASQKQLETLPGIGPALAERIVQHRAKNGNFKRVEELMNVKGIGEKKFLRLKDSIFVTQATRKSTTEKN